MISLFQNVSHQRLPNRLIQTLTPYESVKVYSPDFAAFRGVDQDAEAEVDARVKQEPNECLIASLTTTS